MSVKITLNVEADSSDELRDAIFELANSYSGGASDTNEVQAEAPKNRGGRPRKPATTDAAPATTASGDPAASQEAPGSASGPTATTAASPSEPAASPAAGGVTKEQVAAALQAAMGAASPKAVQDALLAKNLGGRLSEIKPEDYGTALEVLNGLTLSS